MINIKAWIEAFRLRTLPLALSSVFMGTFIAAFQDRFSWLILVLTATTTLFLQILSNLANDYGDFVSGADSPDRIGPDRMVASGRIKPMQMKRMMIVFALLSFIAGVTLLYIAFSGKVDLITVLFLIIGLMAIAAAIKYTVGKSPYGYNGFGDVFVFLFFGLVGVMGSYFLYTLSFDWAVLLPAIAIGAFSTGVLNLNNMRDEKSDQESGKNTLVVRKGQAWAKKYHTLLLVVAPISLLAFVMLRFHSIYQLLFLVLTPLYIRNVVVVLRNAQSVRLDPELKRLAITTLLTVLIFGFSHIFS